MHQSIVAARYAQALFDLTAGQGAEELSKVSTVLLDFKQSLNDSVEFDSFAKDPIFSCEEKKKVLAAVLQKMDVSSIVLHFFFLLADKQRLGLVSEIALHFRTLLDSKENISRGTLTTAIEIDESHKQSIIASLEKQTGRKLVLTFMVDPTLLGGMVLKVGDVVLDSSLTTQLNKLNHTIKRGGGE